MSTAAGTPDFGHAPGGVIVVVTRCWLARLLDGSFLAVVVVTRCWLARLLDGSFLAVVVVTRP